MQKPTQPIAKVFAIIFAILFVITALASILLLTTVKQAFNPEVYKQALLSTGVYERLPQLIGEQIVFSVNRNPCLQDPTSCTEEQLVSTPAYLSVVDASEWATILSGLVDSDWLMTQMESVIDQVSTFLSTPGQPFRMDISLVELKNRLRGEAGYLAILDLLNSLEPCTTIDLLSLPAAALNADNPINLPLCRPSETVLKLGESAIRESLKVIADKIPDNTAALIETSTPGLDNSLAVTQRSLQLLRTLAWISPLIPLCLLLVITLLVVRNLKGFLTWWGIPLIYVSFLLFMCSLLVTPTVGGLVSSRVNAIGLAPGWIEIIQNVILSIIYSFRNSLNLQAGILLLVGCLMFVASKLIHNRSDIGSA